jgi:hypothetical protein
VNAENSRAKDLRLGKMSFGRQKKKPPLFDEGEEARLCGGLWTIYIFNLMVILSAPAGQVNPFLGFFEKFIAVIVTPCEICGYSDDCAESAS